MSKPEEIKKSILALLGKEGGRPLNKSELARALDLPGTMRKKLRENLADLVEAGEISQGKKGRYQVGTSGRSREGLVGKLRVTPGGHGWFFVDKNDEGNVATGIDFEEQDRFYVSPRAMAVALNGDRVRVRLVKNHGGSREHKDLRARVIEVVERRSSKVTGIFLKKGKFSSVRTEDERLPPTIRVGNTLDARSGQLVVVEITEWNHLKEIPKGHLVEVLGWPGDPGVDVEAIVHHHGINATFSPEVVEAARGIPIEIPESEIARRSDWRERDVITIDPETAKDFDDAVLAERTEKGWRLAVHIADVSHYVKPESILDQEARERGNSTYLVDRVIPMLPEELSNGICSLVPQEDRLTKCAVINFDANGRVLKSEFYDAVIRTPRKFTYAEAQEILENPGKGGKLGRRIREAWELASILRKRRFDNGGLDLEMPEVNIILDEKGIPTGYHREEYNESHQLIEEFMLAANEVVARKVKNSGRPTIYRVHEDPDLDKLEEFAELARSHGYEPGDLTNRKHIQKLIDSAKGSLEEPAIKVGLLKSLKRACYLSSPDGHYGLAKNDYCHFTSPIRRYADLVMHRALQSLLKNRPKDCDRMPNAEYCNEIAEHISDTERTSADAESESRRMKMLEWLELSSRENPPPVFAAIITEVRALGLFIECTDILQKGLVKREGFPEGQRWFFENNADRFANSRGQVIQAGTRLKVVVETVDRIGMKADFKIVEVVGGSLGKKVAGKKSARRGLGWNDDPKQAKKKQSGRGKPNGRRKLARKQTRRNRSKRR
ncbi:MAG: ribonuclease R [Akkermansiaceae bacterium]